MIEIDNELAEAIEDLIPEHMREAVRWWIERGEPRPSTMGSFFRAVLCNDLIESFARADLINALCMRNWAQFLREHAPRGSYGSPADLLAWYAAHHPTDAP